MSAIALDVLYIHNDDLGAPVGALFGVGLYTDPTDLSFNREDDERFKRIERERHAVTQAEYRQAERYEERDEEKGITLTPGMQFVCNDGSTATLELPAQDQRAEGARGWHLHKDNGMSYWGYTEQEMKRVVRLEQQVKEVIQ